MKEMIKAAVSDAVYRKIVEAQTAKIVEKEDDVDDDIRDDGDKKDDKEKDEDDESLEESLKVDALKNGKSVKIDVKDIKTLRQMAKTNEYDGFIVKEKGKETEYAVSNGKLVEL